MRDLSPQHCSRLLVMTLVAWAVVWGASLAVGAPQDPALSTEVPLVWQDESYRCSAVDPESAPQDPARPPKYPSSGKMNRTAVLPSIPSRKKRRRTTRRVSNSRRFRLFWIIRTRLVAVRGTVSRCASHATTTFVGSAAAVVRLAGPKRRLAK